MEKNHIMEILENSIIAYTKMDSNIDGKNIVRNIFKILKENEEDIIKANKIDLKNNNGFQIDFGVFDKLENDLRNIGDSYRRVIFMNKTKDNYIEGQQTDNLGTICLVYDGNTYCLLEIILKSILTHNAIIITNESDYMKATNELILILIQRILESYKIDKNLVQILYTTRMKELLSNNAFINKVIAVGNRDFQNKIKEISKIEVISSGYNYFDLYIEDLTHLNYIEEIVEKERNIDIYVKDNLKVPFEDYIIEVKNIDEAIFFINFNSSGYSSSIFTDNAQNAHIFLKDVKTKNIAVNSSPLIKNNIELDIDLFLKKKNMFYPNPLGEDNEKNKIEIPMKK